jgi:hypothetical protein
VEGINGPQVFAGFDEVDKRPGLNAEYVPLVDRLIAEPLSPEEKLEIETRGTSDPVHWVLPTRPLPKSYLSFLAWSNGGLFIKGNTEFAMLGGEELREYLLTYELPATMPGAVAVGADGLGGLYLIDTRKLADANGEYPILHVHAGRFTYDDAEVVAAQFVDLFSHRHASSFA